MNRHITTEQILEYLDGSLDEQVVGHHIRTCRECAALVEDLRRIDAALGQLPVLKPGPALTGRVMERVLKAPGEALSYRLLKGLAFVAPMTIVIVVLGAVFSMTGVINLQGSRSDGTRLQTLLETVVAVSQTVNSFLNDLLRANAPFMTNGESVGITITILVILTMFGLFDRMVGTKIAGRFR